MRALLRARENLGRLKRVDVDVDVDVEFNR